MLEHALNVRTLLAVVSLVSAAVQSQSPAGPRSTRDPVAAALRQPPQMLEHAHGATAAGDRYEAEIDAGAMRFRPVLGRNAEKAVTWRFQLESVARGDDLILSAGKDLPRVEIAGRTAVLTRSATIRERYEARAEGLEQSFEFLAAPGGRGDLIVRGRISTELGAERCADGSLRFGLPGVGGVSVGTVTGIDALGRSAAGSLRLNGESLELVLPAEFVDTAAWPLVLDPLIGTWFDPTFDASWDNLTPDVAYDADHDQYLVAWVRAFAANEQQIRAQRIDGAGNAVHSLCLVTTDTQVHSRPRVCNVNAADRFLLVWLAPVAGGVQVVKGSSVDAASSFYTQPPVTLVAPTFLGQPHSANLPCVAGDLSSTNSGAILVYHSLGGTSSVYAARVELTATGYLGILPGNTHALWNSVALVPYGLNISKTGGSAGRHVVTLSYAGLQARIADRDALPIGSAVVVDPHTGGRNFNPAVDGNGSEFLCVWEKERGSGAADRDVWCTSLQASGSGLSVGTTKTRLNPYAYAGDSSIEPDIAFLGGKYAVCFQESNPVAPGWDDIKLGMLFGDCTVCGPWHDCFGVYDAYELDSGPRLIGKRAGALWADDQGLLVWADRDRATNDSDLRAQRFVSRSQGLSPTVIAPGCGNGGTGGATGSGFVFGNQSFAFTLNGADPNALVLSGIGLATPTIGCGPCQFLSKGWFESVANVSGTARRPFALPCDGSLLDAVIQVQWLSINTGTSPCALVPSLATSQILQFQLVP